jgi:holo-[acyl-carrier protein] synthase
MGVPLAGIDAADIARIARVVERWGDRFLHRVYTPAELGYCGSSMERLAGRFAAKEAVSKVLGTGVGCVLWTEMEILPGPKGRPAVALHGAAKSAAKALRLGDISVSITHTGNLAMACAVALVHSDGGSVETAG